MKAIDKLYALTLTIIIISLNSSFIYGGWMPFFNRTWLFVLFPVILAVILYYKGLKLKFMFPLLLYGFVLYINVFSGDKKFDFSFSTMELFVFIFITYNFYVYSKSSFFKARQVLIFCYIIVLIIAFIGTSIAYQQNPDLIRMIQSERNDGDGTLFALYSKLGVESYYMGHALPSLIPIYVYSIKKGNLQFRIFGFVLLFMTIALIYMSTATTALLLSIVLLILSTIWNEKNKKINIITLIICSGVVLFLLTDRNFISDLLNSFNFDSETTYAKKVIDFQDYADYGVAGGQTQGRFDLYEQSLLIFFNSPLLGTDILEIGNHSVFFDRLATLGLMGFIPLILFLYFYMRYILKKIPNDVKPYCAFGFGFFIIMCCLKNIFNFEFVSTCLLLMPLMCLLVGETNITIIDYRNKYSMHC